MTRKRTPHWFALVFTVVVVYAAISIAANEITYERHVRPVLKTHCFHCHGEGDELAGGLDVRLRRLIAKGGESGPAIISKQPAESLLLERIKSGEMPPKEVELRLTEAELAMIEQWIAGGAEAKFDEPDDLDPENYITEEERSFWAFQPVKAHSPPTIKQAERIRTTIDQFLLAKLEANELCFSSDADQRTLVRRVYFDLLGLPPTPEHVNYFISDESPGAYERLIERVLKSPHYGERWGRHWLDVAGYADSEGYTEDDPIRPYAYKYRDYVIQALNNDKPFDQFIVEQLAGDELLTPPFENLTPKQAEKLIATGFLRMAPDGTGTSNVDQNIARNDVVAKTIEIASTSLLGLTVGCAQCHNHRYDPISQVDYYAIRAIFEPSLDWKNWLTPQKRRVSLFTDTDRMKSAEIEAEAKKILDQRTKKQEEFILATFERELAKLEEHFREPIRKARETPEKERTAEQKKLLKEHPSTNVTAGSLYLYDRKAADELKKMQEIANAIRATKPKEEYVRAVWEPTGKALPKTFLFHRGDHEQPKQQLEPRELTVFTSMKAVDFSANDEALPTSGRRLTYAKWLTSGDHPLVARVIVNRIWLNHFGRGLVPTPGDFGALGAEPTHPELLDWLANEFVVSGWSVKHLHRLMMTSTAYRQSSLRRPEGDAVDADNSLYWRMPIRRLEAEVLRDSALAVSDELNLKPFGEAVPVMADRVGRFVVGKENLNAGRPGAVIPMKGEDLRRSIYIEARRSRPLSVLAPFDLPRMEPNCTSRKASTVAPQALMLMNSQFAATRAKEFARRVENQADNEVAKQIQIAWQLAFASEPSEDELNEAISFVEAQTKHFTANPPPDSKDTKNVKPRQEALASFCHALLSSNRFLYID